MVIVINIDMDVLEHYEHKVLLPNINLNVQLNGMGSYDSLLTRAHFFGSKQATATTAQSSKSKGQMKWPYQHGCIGWPWLVGPIMPIGINRSSLPPSLSHVWIGEPSICCFI